MSHLKVIVSVLNEFVIGQTAIFRDLSLFTGYCSWSLYPYVCPHVSARRPLDGFYWKLTLRALWKSVEISQIWLKLDKNVGHFTGWLLPAKLNRH